MEIFTFHLGLYSRHTHIHTYTYILLIEESVAFSSLHIVIWLLTHAASYRPKQGTFWIFVFSRLSFRTAQSLAVRGWQERHSSSGTVLG